MPDEKRHTVYLARICEVDDDWVLHCHDEAVFSSHAKALAYLADLVFDSPLTDDSERSIAQITAHRLDETEYYSKERWHYDQAGKLLEYKDPQACIDALFLPKPEDYTQKYHPGDIVFLKRTSWPPCGGRPGTICVIQIVPLTYEEWKQTEEGQMEEPQPDGSRYVWSPDYRVEFLTESGTLEHDHVLESELEPYTEPLPEELWFLRHLSEHYKGIRKIKEEALGEMEAGRLSGLHRPVFGEAHFEE